MQFEKMNNKDLEAYIFDQQNMLDKAKKLLNTRLRVQTATERVTSAVDVCTKQYAEVKRLCMEMFKLEDAEEIEVKLQGIAGKAQELRHSLTKFTGALIYVQTGSDPENL